jgi:tetratricopeptide (TPR) repeat protein
MSHPDDSRPLAPVIPLAGRVPRRAPRPAPPAPLAGGEEEDDASLLACLEAQQLDEAIVAAERDIVRGDVDEVETLAELRNRRALRSFLRGDHVAAVAEWQAIIDEDPRRTNALELRRIYLAEIGDLAGARADLDHLIRLSPRSAEAYRSRGVFFCCHGDLERARMDYEREANLAPGDHETYVLLASVLSQAHDYLAAVRALGRAITLAPWSADLYAARAKEHTLAGQHDDAVKDLERVIALQGGKIVETHLLLAEAHRTRGDLPAAAAAYRDAIHHDASQHCALRERMQGNRDAGRTEAQREDLEILLLIDPTDS